MVDIIGTIINVQDFLSNTETNVRINKGSTGEIAFSLEANRKYIVPDFQREIKWKKENLIELMKDISQRPKFLGNVILAQSSNGEYQIIDGQQRITVLLMLINYVLNRYHEEITEIIVPCDINIESFSQYEVFAKNMYSYNGMDSTKIGNIQKSDIFNQAETYQALYNTIENVDILENATKARKFLSNLLECEINVMLSKENSLKKSIDYFLDVNIKGVKLDTEDIFKGYLYSYDKGADIRNKWENLRKLIFHYNNLCQKVTHSKKREPLYPLIKVLNHYFYCDLYSSYTQYAKLEFNEDFLLSKEFVNTDNEKFYTGEHLIKVINNNTYMRKSIDRICELLRITINIIENESPSVAFKNRLTSKSGKDNLDDKEIHIIYNFIRKLLLDNNLVPKSMVMKYILSTFMKDSAPTKKEICYIYTTYFLAVLFSVFENKKGKDAIIKVLKASEWQSSAFDQIEQYLKNSAENSYTAQYKYATDPEDEDQRYRAISLATIYNYFEIKEKGVILKDGVVSSLQNYLSNSNEYSVEHFVINNGDSCKYRIDSEIIEYPYIKTTKKYAKSIFNFIFIPEELNQDLNSYSLKDKLNIIKDEQRVTCKYSKMVIEKISTVFTQPILSSKDSKTQSLNKLNSYYSYEFTNEFATLVQEIVTEFFNKFIKNKEQ